MPELLTGLVEFGRILKTDDQFHGLELVCPDHLSAQLLQGGDVIATAWLENNFAHFGPPVAAAMGEEAKNSVAPRFIFADLAEA